MTTLEILKGVRELLTDPAHWTRGVLARIGQRRRPATPLSDEATCWCWVGAVYRAAGPSPHDVDINAAGIEGAFDAFANTIGIHPFNISHWNDNRRRTHSQVLDATDRTIARLEVQP